LRVKPYGSGPEATPCRRVHSGGGEGRRGEERRGETPRNTTTQETSRRLCCGIGMCRRHEGGKSKARFVPVMGWVDGLTPSASSKVAGGRCIGRRRVVGLRETGGRVTDAVLRIRVCRAALQIAWRPIRARPWGPALYKAPETRRPSACLQPAAFLRRDQQRIASPSLIAPCVVAEQLDQQLPAVANPTRCNALDAADLHFHAHRVPRRVAASLSSALDAASLLVLQRVRVGLFWLFWLFISSSSSPPVSQPARSSGSLSSFAFLYFVVFSIASASRVAVTVVALCLAA